MSAEGAERDYGVVIRQDGGTLALDEPATARLRLKMQAARQTGEA